MDIHVLILYVYGYSNIQMSYNFLVGHTGLYRAFYNLIITIMPFVMKRYGRISAILVFELGGGGVYRSTGHRKIDQTNRLTVMYLPLNTYPGT
jgi:hypothetical protein